jgi:hypothetical protein
LVEQDLSPLHIIQTGSEAHPLSYTMSTRGPFPMAKVAKPTTYLKLVLRHPLPIRLHGVMQISLITGTTWPFTLFEYAFFSFAFHFEVLTTEMYSDFIFAVFCLENWMKHWLHSTHVQGLSW